MTPRKAAATGTLAALVPLWAASYRLGLAFPQARAGAWPYLLGAAYGLSVLSLGGLCAYLAALREMRADMAVHSMVPPRRGARMRP